MTTPENRKDEDETTERAGNAGALAAASEDHDEAGDPLGPLNRLTEDEEE